MLARFMHSRTETIEEWEVSDHEDVVRLLAYVIDLAADLGIGTSAIVLAHDSGSQLMLAPTTEGIVMMWTDPLEDTFHSVGSVSTKGVVVFSYFGEYSEVPAEFAVPSKLAVEAADVFIRSGIPSVEGLIFQAD